ncbi:gluconate 2-dehydrogenase subunit 3 family protein [Humibacter antri]
MSVLPLNPAHGGGRYPRFDVMAQAKHWDIATRTVVQSRLGRLPGIRFFTQQEHAAAAALFDQLLYQRTEPRVPVVQMVDMRLAEKQTDGWHYDSMPPDDQAWRDTLAGLDADAVAAHGTTLAECSWEDQSAILQAVQDLESSLWHDMNAAHVWSLWTRYACAAFYSHPWAWEEIGFDGPAYPRGYKNLGVDKLEPFEVHDSHPYDNPLPEDHG